MKTLNPRDQARYQDQTAFDQVCFYPPRGSSRGMVTRCTEHARIMDATLGVIIEPLSRTPVDTQPCIHATMGAKGLGIAAGIIPVEWRYLSPEGM